MRNNYHKGNAILGIVIICIFLLIYGVKRLFEYLF
jgi:hypothetical protein